MSLSDRVAIVTGAAAGIGRSIALRFAKEGANIVIADVDLDGARKVADEINKLGRKALPLKVDISQQSHVVEMVRKAVEKFGRIDILVNNAGIVLPCAFLDSTEEIWDRTMDVNLKGAYLCCKEVAPIMLNQKRGKIINISSTAGLALPLALENTPYAVSKAGVIGLTRSLAVNLGPYVNVNAICPGFIEAGASLRLNTPEFNAMQIKESLLKRSGKPEEIASAALFLASNESDFITGEIITVSGGRGMR